MSSDQLLAQVVTQARIKAAVQAERQRGNQMLQALAVKMRSKWVEAQTVSPDCSSGHHMDASAACCHVLHISINSALSYQIVYCNVHQQDMSAGTTLSRSRPAFHITDSLSYRRQPFDFAYSILQTARSSLAWSKWQQANLRPLENHI